MTDGSEQVPLQPEIITGTLELIEPAREPIKFENRIIPKRMAEFVAQIYHNDKRKIHPPKSG